MAMTKEREAGTPVLVAPDGSGTPLSMEEYEAVRRFLASRELEEGAPFAPPSDLIGTGEAAALLGVSRQTLNRMLDAGEIPYERYGAGRHRRVSRADVLAFRERSRLQRAQALADMRQAASEAGLYDIDLGAGA